MTANSPIFKIPFADLHPIVKKIVGVPIDSYKIVIQQKKLGPSGICGDYLVPTIDYLLKSGKRGKITVFVRRPHRKRPGSLQQHHYEYLASQGIPIPKLYGVITDTKGREVLFLEYLEEIVNEDAFLRDKNKTKEYLSLMARFNVIELSLEYIAQLGQDMANREWVLNWDIWLTWAIRALDILQKRALNDELDKPLKVLFQKSPQKLIGLREMSVKLMNYINGFKKGYVHGDFYPGNLGWRRDDKELVVFDFEDVMINNRFYDVARYLGAPDKTEERCDTQNNLAKYYLKEYRSFGGDSVSVKEFLREIYITWLAWKCNLWLPNIDGSEVWKKATKEKKLKRGAQINEHLNVLFSQLPIFEKQI